MCKANKKNYSTASTEQGRALAEKNAKILADAFRAVGIAVEIETFSPCWASGYANRRPETVTSVTLKQFYDSDGEPIDFLFGHNNGFVVK